MTDERRAFSPSNLSEKADDYHGSCKFVRTSPDLSSKDVKSVNIEIPFEEAIRFSLAVQSAVMRLNRYNRIRKDSRDMGLCLSLKTETSQVSVIEQRIKPSG